MNKILFVGINARWTHSNPALFYLRTYVADLNYHLKIIEFTINQSFWEIISEIHENDPDVIAFSVYIWNTRIIKDIIPEVKKILPNSLIILGGPEVSYNPQKWLQNFPEINHIICGNGETAFRKLLLSDFDPVLTIMQETNPPFTTIPFPYLLSDNALLQNKYLYYEASRGCPFHCSYCLSSREDQKLSFRSLPQVFQELDFLLEFEPKIIKFVDRTFNADQLFSRSIWMFLAEKKGKTKFHFEIHPDILTDDDFKVLETIPANIFQFEIGIQSLNPPTLTEINRNFDLDKTLKNIEKLLKFDNINIHLDLIAGLPFENLEIFKHSFDPVYKLGAHHLQLGFLKVLPGTEMAEKSDSYDLKYQNESPYQILENKWLNFNELIQLKKMEKLLDIFYNSGDFGTILNEFDEIYTSPLEFYLQLTKFIKSQYHTPNFTVWTKTARILHAFLNIYHKNKSDLLLDCLRWDWCKIAKSHYYPDFLLSEELFRLKTDNFQQVKKIILQNYPESDNSTIKRAIFFKAKTKRFSRKYLTGKSKAVLFKINNKLVIHPI